MDYKLELQSLVCLSVQIINLTWKKKRKEQKNPTTVSTRNVLTLCQMCMYIYKSIYLDISRHIINLYMIPCFSNLVLSYSTKFLIGCNFIPSKDRLLAEKRNERN